MPAQATTGVRGGSPARKFPGLRRWRIPFLQVGLAAAILALWEIGVRVGLLATYFYGQPSGIFRELYQGIASGVLLRHAGVTAFEAFTGFLIGSVLGSVAGLLLWLWPTLAAVLRPFLIALNGLPKIALAPLIIVWFGIEMESKIAIAAIITFIVAMLTSFTGSQEVDGDYIRMLRAMGARRTQIFRMAIIPGSMPWIASALHLNVGFAMIGAMVGEYISAKVGIGYFIYYSGTIYKLNAVFAGIFILMAIALLFDILVRRFEHWLLARM